MRLITLSRATQLHTNGVKIEHLYLLDGVAQCRRRNSGGDFARWGQNHLFLHALIVGFIMKLSSNKQLYEYLVSLSAELKSAHADELSALVTKASRTAGGIPITEFLGESHIALRRVSAEENGILSNEKHAE